MSSKSIYVIIPAYNEEKNIENVVENLKQLDMELKIVVVDDGSQDNTAEKARNAGALVLRHLVNLGQWAALRTAFTFAILNNAEIIATLDADGQHSPKNLYELIPPVVQGKADLVIGSRFMGRSKPQMHTHRYFGIKFFNKILKLITGLELSDCTSGYKVYSADLVRRLLPLLSENQYGALEALIEASRLGANVCEKPVTSNTSDRTTKGRLRYAYNLTRTLFKSMVL